MLTPSLQSLRPMLMNPLFRANHFPWPKALVIPLMVPLWINCWWWKWLRRGVNVLIQNCSSYGRCAAAKAPIEAHADSVASVFGPAVIFLSTLTLVEPLKVLVKNSEVLLSLLPSTTVLLHKSRESYHENLCYQGTFYSLWLLLFLSSVSCIIVFGII